MQSHEAMAQAVLDFLRPKPSPVKLTRIGGARDGAYLVPQDFEGVVACFSPGVDNRKKFEDELFEKFGMRSHMLDRSSDESFFATPLIPDFQTFEKKWLDVDGAESSLSLEDWVLRQEPNTSGDFLLQMDIEGAEYRNILASPQKILGRFRIAVIELHNLIKMLESSRDIAILHEFMRKLDRNFTVVHVHPNNCSIVRRDLTSGLSLPDVLEVSLIRKDRVMQHSSARHYPASLPHPLDILPNCRGRPPILLDRSWLSDRRSFMSTFRLLVDFIHYWSFALVSKLIGVFQFQRVKVKR